MARLREIFAPLRLGDVEAFIASGNVVFTVGGAGARDTAALERRIARALADALGWEVATFVRTIDEVAVLAARDPFPQAAEGDAIHVGFLHAAPDATALARVQVLASAGNTFLVEGRDLWWWARGRSSESGLDNGKIERALRAAMTMRNVTTVRRLAAKYASA